MKKNPVGSIPSRTALLIGLIGTLFTFLSTSGLSAETDYDTPARSRNSGGKEFAISRIYSAHALKAYHDGEQDTAERLAEVSLVFDDANRDALAIRALLSRQGGDLSTSLSLFEKAAALEEDPSYSIPLALIHEELAAIAFRSGLVERAYLYLTAVTDEGELPVGTGMLYVRILQRLGRNSEAREVSRELASRYPEHQEVLKQFLELNTAFVPPFLVKPIPPVGITAPAGESARSNGSSTANLWPELEGYDKTVLQLLIRRIDDQLLREKLYGYYAGRFGKDPFWTLGWGAGQTDSDEERKKMLIDSLEAFPVQEREELEEYGVSAKALSLDGPFNEFLDGFSGILEGDRDRDGYIEEREMYRNGILEAFYRDADQDGIFETSLLLDDGVPETFNNASWLVLYSTYPYLKKVVSFRESGETTYTLYPYDLAYPVRYKTTLREILEAPEGEEAVLLSFPREDQLSSRSLEIVNRPVTDDREIRREPLFNGAGSLVLLKDREGRIEERRTGEEGYTLREKDLDQDGRFELVERYLSDTLIEIRLDRDGDGNAEYAESYGERTTLLWDFNDDGLFDCRQYDQGSGIVREFSTMLDGSFDYRIEVKD